MKRAFWFMLCCLLPTLALGGVVSILPGDNVQGKINASQPGDVIQFRGAFNTPGLFLPDNHTYTTPNDDPSEATLSISTGVNQYALVCPANASKLLVSGLTIKTNCGVVNFVGPNTDCAVLNNDIAFASNGTSFYRIAVNGYNGNTRLRIMRNWFHDAPSEDRTINLFNTNNCTISFNRYDRVREGGHIDGDHENLLISDNWQSGCGYMGWEIQNNNHFQPGNAGNNILVARNTFILPSGGDQNCFGVSSMLQNAVNFVTRDNYWSFVGGTIRPGGVNFGYLAEWGGGATDPNSPAAKTNLLANNILIAHPSIRANAGVAFSMPNSRIQGNRIYGMSGTGWARAWFAEPGNGNPNHGVMIDLGGNQDNLPISSAPPPPAPPAVAARGLGVGGSTTQPVDNKPTSASATTERDAQGKSVICIKWVGGKAPFIITRTWGGGSDTIIRDSGTEYVDNRFTDQQRHDTWVFGYDVTGTNAGTAQLQQDAVVSDPITKVTITHQSGQVSTSTTSPITNVTITHADGTVETFKP